MSPGVSPRPSLNAFLRFGLQGVAVVSPGVSPRPSLNGDRHSMDFGR